MKRYLALIGKGTKRKCGGILLLALLGAVLASAWPVLLGRLYTEISTGRIATVPAAAAGVTLFVGLYLAAEGITILRRVLLDCVIAEHEAQVRENSAEKLLRLPVRYFSDALSGERTAQLNQGVAGLSQLIKITCNDIFATVLTAVCTLVQVILNAPAAMAGIMLVYLLLTMGLSAFQIRSQNGVRESIVAQKNALDGQLCQAISNLELIRGMHAERYERLRLRPRIRQISRTEQRHHRCMGRYDMAKQVCKILFQAGLLMASVCLISVGSMHPGGVITVCLLFQQLVVPIDGVFRLMDETASSVVKARALTQLGEVGDDPVFSICTHLDQAEDGDICFRNVEVTTPDGAKRLGFYRDLRIPGGQVVALQGKSGCGKTTLIRGLNRYYPCASGRITLFGNALENYSQQDLARRLFYLPQQSYFFAGTVRENRVYGLDGQVPDEELLHALERASLLQVLQQKAERMGVSGALDCEIGEGGSGLSGGERHRLSIARAFLRSPRLYIFDESTANLDQDTARKVLDQVEAHARAIGAGVLYISHDENVVARCQHVIWLNNAVSEVKEPPAA